MDEKCWLLNKVIKLKKKRFIGTYLSSSGIYVRFMAALVLQQQSWVAATKNMAAHKSKDVYSIALVICWDYHNKPGVGLNNKNLFSR